ncbi:hypothetical protein TNCV_150621 [Trichonephila clavipes]|nr:hypothetical protein TNCV_150621 [Trichonephila clavipes]
MPVIISINGNSGKNMIIMTRHFPSHRKAIPIDQKTYVDHSNNLPKAVKIGIIMLSAGGRSANSWQQQTATMNPRY